jgi:RNA polymerase sigma-70 factor (ECF subfamily)
LDLRSKQARFESTVLIHIDAAHNLARWVLRNDQDAEDVVQDACLRAYRSYETLRGEARPWFLRIVRNAAYDLSGRPKTTSLDDIPMGVSADDPAGDPVASVFRSADIALVQEALAALPDDAREILVLRDLEGLSYREISTIQDVPIGTVMSRLSRARRRLQTQLESRMGEKL